MEAPARTARRLFLGLGLALLLATAFALIDGRLPPSVCEEDVYGCTASSELGWLLPVAAALSIFAGLLLHLSIDMGVSTPLLSLFPLEGTKEQRENIFNDLSDSQDESELSDAWADLEQDLLSPAIVEEE
ncbi:MAG: hypothetical protein HOE69_06970 [Euryarchaeota archaeon]|jgi:hypothetical protein|nr:hypothetical protein [Euryarchaeota archaeon]